MIHVARIEIRMTGNDGVRATPKRLGVTRERLLAFRQVFQRNRSPIGHTSRIDELSVFSAPPWLVDL